MASELTGFQKVPWESPAKMKTRRNQVFSLVTDFTDNFYTV